MAKAMAPRMPENQIMNCWPCGIRRSGGRSELTTAAAGHMLTARDTASATTATTCDDTDDLLSQVTLYKIYYTIIHTLQKFARILSS